MVTRSGRRRPTIEDVAAEAGVSRGTVSRVLNGGHWVSADKLQAVNAAIKKTQYRVNPHARGLVTRRSDSVAFLLTERHELLFEDPNFSRLMRGTAEALAERDVSLVLIMAGTPDEQRRAKEFIIAGHIDGVLLVSWHSGARDLVNDIHLAGVPVVACGVPLGFERSLGYVAADDEEGARTMTAHLRGLGRTRVETITGPPDTSGGTKRLEGYRAELGDAFDPALVAVGDYGVESGARAMAELLERAPDLDAVFAANDLMATGALRVLAERGRRVPEDVAVGGFDDSPVAATASPALTTMRQPFDRVSSEMVRLLMQVIEGERPASIVLPTDLVIRDSA
ncbi:LacI family DNA-binding transcriptional regulator [Clavibacter sepedonicus]|uniref:LacI-family transcriptional regulator n=1 Tax=Clavibacter sepedonicus TaxID=31964 RepID=B0RI85_CLASE|nr:MULTISPECIES: LacI family DNA-binding transcriptional regulator [Clavibacter]MBD5381158.1 LacI family transcriptional regulator [Clavibacter sp.]OQJ48214.1 LacI family transcriptional regulator [Clavibacter sepedonicus]OQJ54538.1 LacI family transcriptional regulator [Clavibacter sepedonicus]UUK66109.1 LacI family transcriptional regulator [Clavibacter sepedonicus]CAQ02656.1 putative LacI-family transcriptional regulator [Clavibacter sepedonicus]